MSAELMGVLGAREITTPSLKSPANTSDLGKTPVSQIVKRKLCFAFVFGKNAAIMREKLQTPVINPNK